MVKCVFCSKHGKNLEKCRYCKKNFHEKCGEKHLVSENKKSCNLHKDEINSKKILNKKCHRCLCEVSENKYFECSNDDCQEIYCHRCVKNRYKIDIDLDQHWECFVCTKLCACKSCRMEATAKNRKYNIDFITDFHVCHSCNKKSAVSKVRECENCKNFICFSCMEKDYKAIHGCPVCLDICVCTLCGDKRFNNDFPDFHKGVDVRKLYPYDLKNIFCVNGFWVRSINL